MSWTSTGAGTLRWEGTSRGGRILRRACTTHCRKKRWRRPTVRLGRKESVGEARGTTACTRASVQPPRTPTTFSTCRPCPLTSSAGPHHPRACLLMPTARQDEPSATAISRISQPPKCCPPRTAGFRLCHLASSVPSHRTESTGPGLRGGQPDVMARPCPRTPGLLVAVEGLSLGSVSLPGDGDTSL